MKEKKALDIWSTLDAKKNIISKRWEQYAALTLPYLYTPLNVNPDDYGQAKDWQSVGSQCVNHLSTRMMLALFAPSRPFLRLDAGPQLIAEAAEANLPPEDLAEALAESEQETVKLLDQLALRPKLFEALKHLIVLGNVATVEDEKEQTMRVLSVKHWCIKRNIQGALHTAIIREQVLFDELDEEVRKNPLVVQRYGMNDDALVDYFVLIQREGGKLVVSEHVGDIDLGPRFRNEYADELACPYKFHTWTLADEADYGQGMVGDNEGDLESLSTLSRAIIEGAILASEYRWLVSPSGNTQVDDFKNSENGEALPGDEGDLTLVQAAREIAASVQIQQQVATDYINRLGRAFLLTSSVTRDAERVTAEEIRLLAGELEAGLGGAYSRLAVDLQKPLAYFLLRIKKIKVGPLDAVPTVVTGLDALSRSGDLAALRAFMQDAVTLLSLPVEAQEWLKMDGLLVDLGNGHGIKATKYVAKFAEVMQQRQQRQAAAIAEANAIAQGQARANATQEAQ